MKAVELTVEEWATLRDDITRQFLGISAEEFMRNFNAGRYDTAVPPENLTEILGYFPDLD